MNFLKYKNPLVYPDRPKMECIQCKAAVRFLPRSKMTGLNSPNYCEHCGFAVKAYLEEKEVEYRAAMLAYNTRTGELEAEFKKDALEEVGLTGHPKADKAYSYAWEHGHASGYSEVFCVLQGVAEVVL